MHRWTTHLDGGPRRVNHAAVVVQDFIYSFGGYCTGDVESVRPMDVHVLNTYCLDWSILQNVKYENCGVPYHRYGHTAVAWSNAAFIFGGRNDRNGACNKLYKFHPATNTWSQVAVNGFVPGARDGHSACVIGDKMFVFGGYEEMAQMFSNEVFSFNFNKSEWTCFTTIGQPASWRDFHSATGIGDMMLVFGGRSDRFGPYHTNSEVYCNKLQIFKTSTNTWFEPPIKGTPPSGRRSHSAVAYEDDLYIFGGYNGLTNVHHNDMYKYSLSENRWSVVKPKGIQPCCRRRQCCCVVGQQMFLFGGTKPDSSAPDDRDAALIDLDDLHVLDFRPTLRTLCMAVVVSQKLDASYLPKDIRFEVDCMTRSRKIRRIMTTSG